MSSSRDYVAGQVLTAAQADDWSQGVLGFATPITANVGPTSAGTELDIITAPAVTIAATNRRLRITFHCRGMTPSIAGDTYLVRIKEGATVLQETHVVTQSTGTGDHTGPGTFVAFVSSPSAASHTYKATVQRSGGSGTITISATATAPITLAVEDVGTV